MYILFDIGGTNMRIALSKDGVEISDVRVMPTPQDFESAMELFEKEARVLSENITYLCGGVAGVFDENTVRLLNAPNIPEWVGVSPKEELERRFGVPVYVRNDAELAGLGEARIGAGKGKNIVAYLTVGTGMGGARIVDGKIDVRNIGFEPGHQIIDMSENENGKFKNLEDCVSGTTFEHEFGYVPKQVTDTKVWDTYARRFAVGVHNTLVYWSPDIVVLGGSMILGKNGIRVEDVKKYTQEYMRIFPTVPDMVPAQLGDYAGLEGARLYLLDRIKK